MSHVRKHLRDFAQLIEVWIHSLPFGPSTTSGATKESFANDAPVRSLRMSRNAAITSTFHTCTRRLPRLHTPVQGASHTLQHRPLRVPPSDANRERSEHQRRRLASKTMGRAAKRTGDRNAKMWSTGAERRVSTRQATTHHIPAKGFPEYIVTSSERRLSSKPMEHDRNQRHDHHANEPSASTPRGAV